ncbi:MAG: universal stress protein, partial [Bradyrhizobiaceae bacterium]|nr:universal stress protein [Bradyrhizobiaceae bacterium]
DLQHPNDIALSNRAERVNRDGPLTVFKRWLRNRSLPPIRRRSLSGLLSRAPIIMVAIDLSPEAESLSQALTTAVQRVLVTAPSARLACVNVMKSQLMATDPIEDAHGRNPHLQRLIELKHWARAFPIAENRMTFHVFESPDAGEAIVDYARNTRVDHIVIGAHGSSTLRRFLGTVSAKVVAEAPCTVTVVRTPQTASGRPMPSMA